MSLEYEINNISILHLKSFIAVAQFLNFTKAADHLFMSQSTLSRNIAYLESNLGVPLFVRKKSSHTVQLTASGKEFLKILPKSIASLDQAILSARSAATGGGGIIRIGFVPYITSNSLTVIIQNFQKQYPDVDIILSDYSGQKLSEAVTSGKVDVGFFSLARALQMSNVGKKHILQCKHQLVVSKNHPLAEKEKVHFSELEDEKFIVSSESPGSEYPSKEMFGILMNMCEQHGFIPRIIKCDTIAGLMTLVGSGIGVAVVSETACEWMPYGVVAKEIEGNTPLYTSVAVWDVNNDNPCLAQFMKVASSVMEK